MDKRKVISLATTAILAGASFYGLADSASAQNKVPLKGTEVAPIRDALMGSEDLQIFDEHLVFLSNPFLQGRLPGTPGMELAKDYMEYYFKQSGLEAPFDLVTEVDGQQKVEPFASYRQPFALRPTRDIVSSELSYGTTSLKKGVDFDVTGFSAPGSFEGPVVFAGYGIQDESRKYMSYSDSADLDGKIVMILRFEPMNEEGKSLWATDGARWSTSSSFERKVEAALKRNAKAVILVNAPGASDRRANSLRVRGRQKDIPVFSMTVDAADAFLKEAHDQSLMELRQWADKNGGIVDINAQIKMGCEIETKSVNAENVAGLVRGKGNLAGEVIVVGAHLDHLGYGEFGSRRGSGNLHPGADDNASGSAGIMLMAHKLVKMYKELPEGTPARSVLFIGFSAEESGLNGSRHYVEEPFIDLERHQCMINFDMVGRIINKRLSVSGGNTAEGFADWLKPHYERSGLDIVESDSMAGSDHIPFFQNKVPVLFGIIADFHDDYHTPDDVSWKINRVDAVRAMNLFLDIVYGQALNPERLVFKEREQSNNGRRTTRSQLRVRFGIRPSYEEGTTGVSVTGITPDMPAAKAGLKAGDVIVKWNGKDVEDISAWMRMLREHKPGDEVKVGVKRGDEDVELTATLTGSN